MRQVPGSGKLRRNCAFPTQFSEGSRVHRKAHFWCHTAFCDGNGASRPYFQRGTRCRGRRPIHTVPIGDWAFTPSSAPRWASPHVHQAYRGEASESVPARNTCSCTLNVSGEAEDIFYDPQDFFYDPRGFFYDPQEFLIRNPFGWGRIKHFGGSWHGLVMSFFTCLSRERVLRALSIDRQGENVFWTES